MVKPFILFLLVASLGNAIYHIGQKTLSQTINPMVLLMALYGIAFVMAAIAAPFFQKGAAPVPLSILWSRPVLLMTFGAFMIEIGFLLAYRTGGSLQWSGSLVNGVAALVLVPVALLVFKESLSFARIAGILVTISGLALMARK